MHIIITTLVCVLSCYVQAYYIKMHHHQPSEIDLNHQAMRRLGNWTWKAFIRNGIFYSTQFFEFISFEYEFVILDVSMSPKEWYRLFEMVKVVQFGSLLMKNHQRKFLILASPFKLDIIFISSFIRSLTLCQYSLLIEYTIQIL